MEPWKNLEKLIEEAKHEMDRRFKERRKVINQDNCSNLAIDLNRLSPLEIHRKYGI